MRKQHYVSRALASLLFLFTAAIGFAQTGVSDNRVSLPEGSGGVDGFADNAQVGGNQGAMSFSVTIQLPKGTGSVAPGLSLGYSSNGGNGLAGMGWSFGLPSIERSSAKGLAQYNVGDRFVENGSSELIFVGEAGQHREYRTRYEGSFNRYRWHNSGEGKEGYWTVESAGGVISYYGASSDGTLASQARMGRSDLGTFKYHVREVVDAFGNKAVYSYLPADDMVDGSTRLISQIDYTFDRQGENPRYSVLFTYESRDDVMSDCKAGYCELIAKRLKTISVVSAGTEMRRYELNYEELSAQADLSRLREVRRYGLADALFPGRYEFEYQKSLGMGCMGGVCAEPYFTDIENSVGANLRSGSATLIDINGDALPDVVNTQNEEHRFYINQLNLDGSQSFNAAGTSGLPAASEFNLSRRRVQTLDVNGDGFSDIVDYSSQVYLKNLGQGDWDSTQSLVAGAGYPQDSVFEDSSGGDGGQLDNLRFFDYDNDKLIDLLYITESSTQIYRTLPNGGTEAVNGVDQVHPDFNGGFEVGVQLTDVNGDGLQDLVKVEPQEFIYRLYLGYGRWTPATRINIPTVTQDLVPSVELEDMNGDGLTDLVIVYDGELQYSLNQNGNAFSEWVTINSVNGRSLPEISESTVLYADMNGNGSVDVVWFDGNGVSSYLELFPERPNLLSQITNNLGKVTKVTYDSSVRERLRSERDGTPWSYKLPHPATLVVQQEVYDGLNNVSDVLTYNYQSGYYDGQEKQFRGYEVTVTTTEANEFQSSGFDRSTFNVGIDDHYYNGLLLKQEIFGLDNDSNPFLIRESRYTHEDCPVAEIPDGMADNEGIRFICQTGSTTEIVEGMPEAKLTTQETSEFDGYGNVIKNTSLGVTAVAGGACAPCTRPSDLFGEPCGPECTGDEGYVDSVFTTPGEALGQWRHDLRVSETSYSDPASPNRQVLTTYFDGEVFVGLPEGEYTKGRIHRETALMTSNETINTGRMRYDEWGNMVQELEPLHEIGEKSGHVFEFDDYGLFIVRDINYLTDENGVQYSLQTQITQNETWSQMSSFVDSTTMRGTETLVAGELFEYAYDEFGRLSHVRYPAPKMGGTRDTADAPTVAYEYNYNNPVTEIVTRHRSQAGGAVDRIHVKCVDGLGRLFQERVSIDNGQYQVSGFIRRNPRGNVVEQYQSYLSDSAQCEQSPPEGVVKKITHFDSLGRKKIEFLPDENIFDGIGSTRIHQYEPFKSLYFDPEDNHEGGYAENTPRIAYKDGNGRLYRVEKYLTAGGEPVTYDVFYDDYGNVKGYKDPAGNERLQIYDRLGRMLRIVDPNFGAESYTYNQNGERTSSTDARGVTTRYELDEVGRVLKEYEEDNRGATEISYFYDYPRECPLSKCTSVSGQLAEVNYPLGDLGEGKTWFGFNGRDTGVYVAKQIGTALFEIETEVNNLGDIVAEIYPGGDRIEYAYRGDGKLKSIANYVDNIEYDSRGLTASVAYHNGVIENYAYNELTQVVGISANTASGSPFVDLRIDRDRVANVTNVTDALDPTRYGHTAEYTFDAFYRLTAAQLGTDEQVESIAYAYNSIENMVSKTSSDPSSPAHVGEYEYSDAQPNAAISAGTSSYMYDASGHMVSRDNLAFDWSYRGNLVEIQNNQGTTVGRNYYGDDGRRLVKDEAGSVTYYVAPKYEVRDGVGVIYVMIGGSRMSVKIEQNARVGALSDLAPFDIDNAFLTPQGDNKINAADAWASHLLSDDNVTAEDGVVVSSVTTLLNASARRLLSLENNSANKVSYYHYDHILSNIAVTSQDGEVDNEYSYYPYATVKYSSGGAAEDRRVANGKETDALTDLTDYGARFADLKLGRFISPDRYFEVVGAESVFAQPQEATGAFIFTNNNPVSNVDKDGKFITNIIGGVAGLIASATQEYVHYKQDVKDGRKPSSKLMIFGKVLMGTAVGALTSGASAVGTLVDIGVEAGSRAALDKWSSKSVDQKRAISKLSGTIIGGLAGVGASMGFAAASVGIQANAVINSTGANTLNSYAVTACSNAGGAATDTGRMIVTVTGASLGGGYKAFLIGKESRNVRKANKAAARNGKVNRKDAKGRDGRLTRQNAFRQRKSKPKTKRRALGGNKARWMMKMAKGRAAKGK